MNKHLKLGLLLQIPNIFILISLIITWIIFNLNWYWLLHNAMFIVALTAYLLINIFSVILISLGIMDKRR
jgi:hypothetical protein